MYVNSQFLEFENKLKKVYISDIIKYPITKYCL